jgi:hypothetical protein
VTANRFAVRHREGMKFPNVAPLFAALLLGCHESPPTNQPIPRVCVALANAEDDQEAIRGIRWWGEPFELACDVTTTNWVAVGPAPALAPNSLAWSDDGGVHIWYVAGPVTWVIRHEWGHVLGFVDTDEGVMACGGQY